MKKQIVLLCFLLLFLVGCDQHSTKEPNNTTTESRVELDATTSPTDETAKPAQEYLDRDQFPVLVVDKVNYKLYTDDHYRGYYYTIHDEYQVLIDSGFCSWRFNSLDYVGQDLLCLQENLGGAMFSAKYYDVKNGYVSRLYYKPAGNSDSLVAYFDTDAQGVKLVVCEIFNPAASVEFRDDSFSACVFTAKATATFLENGSVTISYYSGNADEQLTKTFNL